MKTRQAGICATVAMTAAITMAMSPSLYADPEAGGANPVNQMFEKLDTDHDNYVSRGEAAKLRDFTRAFDAADENHDGRLDRDEFAKAQANYDRMRAKAYISDSVITAKVKAALVKDPDVKSVEVSVTTDKGVVSLFGSVDNEKQAQRAQAIAHSIAGVKSVKSGLVVKS